MTELFNKDQEVKIEEGEDGSIKIGETHYKDKEAAFKGKAEADKHIAITQAENKELRAELDSVKKEQGTALQSLLEKMDATQVKDQERVNEYDDLNEGLSQRKEPSQQYDPETLRKVVQAEVKETISIHDQELQVRNIQMVKEANLDQIRKDLIEKCGSKEEAKAAWEDYQTSPSFDPEIYEMQVLKTPDAIVDAIAPKQTVNFGKGNIPTTGFSSDTDSKVGPRGRSYWAKLMKEKGHHGKGGYYSVELQRQMKDDYATLGKDKYFSS